MSKYTYRIAARTEAAGKYNPSAPREGNEDSLAVFPDVGNLETALSSDTILPLPEKGVLMVVADGMGGHNAGEVASQIAVSTVREMFSPENIAEKTFDTNEARAEYLEKVVVTADKNIRDDANNNLDRQGMGSTIIMAWVVDDALTVTWCGDSRAYRYRPKKGLELLSEDHSLVQDLVKHKRISYEDTFSHPQGNVITRCLGGGGKSNAVPESRQFTLEADDLIMLCSDGLSGVVFDYEKYRDNGEPYSIENLQDILSRPKESLKDTLSCLFDAARRCDWYDNVTVVLFELKADKKLDLKEQSPVPTSDEENVKVEQKKNEEKPKRKLLVLWYFIAGLFLICIGFLLCKLTTPSNNNKDTTIEESTVDSTTNNVVSSEAVAEVESTPQEVTPSQNVPQEVRKPKRETSSPREGQEGVKPNTKQEDAGGETAQPPGQPDLTPSPNQ